MKISLLKTLRNISKEANQNVENINLGGCAVMASIIAKELLKCGVQAEGVCFGQAPSQVRKFLVKGKIYARDWEDNGVCFHHVAVRFKYAGRVFTYDTDRLHRQGNIFGESLTPIKYKFGHGMSLKELEKVSKEKHFWNREFNRDNIPRLRNIVKKHFNAYRTGLTQE